MLIKQCDRCGKIIRKGEAHGTLLFIDKTEGKTVEDAMKFEAFRAEVDYCLKCLDEIAAYAENKTVELPAIMDETADVLPPADDTIKEYDPSKEEPSPEKEAEPEPEEDKPEPQKEYPTLGDPKILKGETVKQRPTLDHKKIMAFHDAGWTNQQIADELDAKKSTVASIISYERKKLAEMAEKIREEK